MFADVSHAKKGGNSGSKVKIEVRAELDPLDTNPPEPDAEGQARHKKETRNGVIKKDEFKATVKIPFPSSALGITTETEAENADIRLILSNTAVCFLEFDEIEDEDDEGEMAEFKVDVRIKKGAVQEKKGMCTLTAGGSVVPDAQDGAVATARHIAAGGTPTDFLQGTFELH
jgi:hypothetical protein